jgi:acyl-CoA thioester hydrolase
MTHLTSIRTYYEDTDAGGVVHHANYIKFCERARSEFLRAFGFSNQKLRDECGVIFMVHNIDASYFKSASLDEDLTVYTSVTQVKRTNVIMDHTIFRENDKLFQCQVTQVCLSAENGRPARFPNVMWDNFNDYLETNVKELKSYKQ